MATAKRAKRPARKRPPTAAERRACASRLRAVKPAYSIEGHRGASPLHVIADAVSPYWHRRGDLTLAQALADLLDGGDAL